MSHFPLIYAKAFQQYSSDVVHELREIRKKIDGIYKLQANEALKLTGKQQSTISLTEKQEHMTRIFE